MRKLTLVSVPLQQMLIDTNILQEPESGSMIPNHRLIALRIAANQKRTDDRRSRR